MRRSQRLQQIKGESGGDSCEGLQVSAPTEGHRPAKRKRPEECAFEANYDADKRSSQGKQHGPTREKEEALWAKGFQAVGGLDEAGRGPLAGPVVAAVCVLPRTTPATLLQDLNDSKLLDEGRREELYALITTMPGVLWAAQVIDNTTIDRINILQAALRAMKEAVMQLPQGSFDYLLVDGNKVPEALPVTAEAIVKGDGKCSCIAAASIIAKVTRDRIMCELDAEYPGYNFRQHKGYGVPEHNAAIYKRGPCAIHRRSFQPIRGITGWTRAGQLAEEAAAAEIAGKEPDYIVVAETTGVLQLEAAAG